MTNADCLRAALAHLDQMAALLDDILLDDWHRRRVDEALHTIQANIERELGRAERRLMAAFVGESGR